MEACFAEASVSLKAQLFDDLRTTVFMIMTVYTKHDTFSFVKKNLVWMLETVNH